MSAATPSLVTSAEAGLARLRQTREMEQDQEARTRARIVSDRAVEARMALQAARDVLPILERFDIRPGAVLGNRLANGRKARTDLRQAATTSLRGEGARRIERLAGPAVNEALK